MSLPEAIETAVQREMLQVALHNSARSVILLTVAVAFVAWLGWQGGHGWSAGMMVVMGLGVAGWRWALNRRHGSQTALAPEQIASVVRQLEGNALLVGLMWCLATVVIYPTLRGTTATVYVVIVAGSVATAAFFMSMAGRSFLLFSVLQLGSLMVVSLPLFALSLALDGPDAVAQALTHPTVPAVLSTIYTAWLASLVGYGIWNTLLAHHPAAAVVPFTMLVPVVGLTTAWLVQGEVPNGWESVGGALLLLGVAVTTGVLGPRSRLGPRVGPGVEPPGREPAGGDPTPAR